MQTDIKQFIQWKVGISKLINIYKLSVLIFAMMLTIHKAQEPLEIEGYIVKGLLQGEMLIKYIKQATMAQSEKCLVGSRFNKEKVYGKIYKSRI